MQLSSMVTMSDWTMGFGTWGEYGVRAIFRKLKEAGMKRVYWRVYDEQALELDGLLKNEDNRN